jgi:hypothetical protein
MARVELLGIQIIAITGKSVPIIYRKGENAIKTKSIFEDRRAEPFNIRRIS